jgi:hypothetical protein
MRKDWYDCACIDQRPKGPAMYRTRLSRIVVRRANAPGTTLGPALARCAADLRRDRSARAADVVWRAVPVAS